MEPEFYDRCNRMLDNSMIRIGLLLFASLLFFALPASASQEGAKVVKNWKAMDLCAKKAQEAFPDHTADANAKRPERLYIDVDGHVKDVRIVESDPEGLFDREVLRAMSKWRYAPQLVNGVAVERPGVTTRFNFKLEKS